MPREWAARHARRTHGSSSTLAPAAFPSLPIDGPRRAAPAAEIRKDSAINFPGSDKDDVPPASPDSDENEVIDIHSKCSILHNLSPTSSQKHSIEDTDATEGEDPDDIEYLFLPNAPGCSTKRPRCINADNLRTQYADLVSKKKSLEYRLRNRDCDFTAVNQALAAGLSNLSKKPVGLDALLEAINDLRKITQSLERIEDEALLKDKAVKRFFSLLPLASSIRQTDRLRETASALRSGARDCTLPSAEWQHDSDWHTMQAMRTSAQRSQLTSSPVEDSWPFTLDGTYTDILQVPVPTQSSPAEAPSSAAEEPQTETNAYGMADWPTPFDMSGPTVLGFPRPMPLSERLRRIKSGVGVFDLNAELDVLDGLADDSAAAYNKNRAITGAGGPN